MKSVRFLTMLAGAMASAAITATAASRSLIWANAGNDMRDASNWTDHSTGVAPATPPGTEDRLFFIGTPSVQPYLGGTMEVRAICFGPVGKNGRTYYDPDDGSGGFGNSGWTISGEEGATLRMSGALNGDGGWNFHFSQASLGTNTIAVPVHFTGTSSGKLLVVQPSGGRLVFAAPVSTAGEATRLMFSSGDGGTAELAVANPGLACTVMVNNWTTLSFADPGAFGTSATLLLNHPGNASQPQRLVNGTGGDVVLASFTSVGSTGRNVACHFEGDGAISFPNATFAPDLSQSREFFADVPLTFRSLGNSHGGGGGFSFRKLGPASMRVTGDIFQDSPPGQTNRIDILDGALVLEDDGYMRRDCVMTGIKGGDMEDRRPALGLTRDIEIAEGGEVPGGMMVYGDHSFYVGLAAYGGDRTATFAGGNYVMIDPEVKHSAGARISGAQAFGAGGSDWYSRGKKFVFGAPDSDGTIAVANTIDLNVANPSVSANYQKLYAVKGKAAVAGRIAGDIVNGGAAGPFGCRIFKEGDGVLALEGSARLMSNDGSWIREGGFMVNGEFFGPIFVTNTATAGYAWLGGTGTLSSTGTVALATTVCGGGGALRPGDEHGRGSLGIGAALVFRDGGRLVVRVGASTNTWLNCTGTGCDYRAMGSVILRIEDDGTLERGRSIKIIDWSGASDPSNLTLIDPTRWKFELPEGSPLHHPRIFHADNALWLKFSVDTGENHKVLFM